MRVKKLYVWAVCLICVGTARPLAAQDGGTVSGAIVDTFGGAISGARLTVRDSAAAVIRMATTDASGAFSFTGLRSGSS